MPESPPSLPIDPWTGPPPRATVRVPGSKSLTNRALIAAALAPGTTKLTNASFSDDSKYLATALNQIGVPVEIRDRDDVILVQGGKPLKPDGDFSVGNYEDQWKDRDGDWQSAKKKAASAEKDAKSSEKKWQDLVAAHQKMKG